MCLVRGRLGETTVPPEELVWAAFRPGDRVVVTGGESAGPGTVLEWKERDATYLVSTAQGASVRVPPHLLSVAPDPGLDDHEDSDDDLTFVPIPRGPRDQGAVIMMHPWDLGFSHDYCSARFQSGRQGGQRHSVESTLRQLLRGGMQQSEFPQIRACQHTDFQLRVYTMSNRRLVVMRLRALAELIRMGYDGGPPSPGDPVVVVDGLFWGKTGVATRPRGDRWEVSLSDAAGDITLRASQLAVGERPDIQVKVRMVSDQEKESWGWVRKHRFSNKVFGAHTELKQEDGSMWRVGLCPGDCSAQVVEMVKAEVMGLRGP